MGESQPATTAIGSVSHVLDTQPRSSGKMIDDA